MVLFENTVPPPIPLVDGADPITTGTPTDAAFYNALKAALNVQLHDTSDPTKHPKDAIAELKAAREGNATLLAKLDAMEAAFTGVGPNEVRNGFEYGNMLANGEGLMWSRADTAAPDYWALGAGAIARCGSGQADTRALSNVRGFSMKLTHSGTPAYLYQRFVSNAMADVMGEGLLDTQLKPVDANGNDIVGYDGGGLVAWAIYHVWSAGTNRARLRLAQASGGTIDSQYHPGDSDWHPLIVGPLGLNTADYTELQLRCETAGDAYFQAGGLWLTRLALPPSYVPAKMVLRAHRFTRIATPAVATDYDAFTPSRPILILGTRATCRTAPTTDAVIYDLKTPISGTYQSLFATLPQIAATKLTSTIQACDPAAANYRRRTIRGVYSAGDATMPDNAEVRLDVTQRDAGATAANVDVTMFYLELDLPFNQFRSMTDVGEA